jgi:Rad3-related DNA helicase
MKCPQCGLELDYCEETKDLNNCIVCGIEYEWDTKDVFESKAAGIIRETREGQIKMARLIEEQIRSEDHVATLIEGGTGIGKSYAYLIPLMLQQRDKRIQVKMGKAQGNWSPEQEEEAKKAAKGKVFISTTKVLLQEQICEKDLNGAIVPKLALNEYVQATILKGASRYGCLHPMILHNLKSPNDQKLYEKFLEPSRESQVAADMDHWNLGDTPKWRWDVSVEECPFSANKRACPYSDYCMPNIKRYNVLVTNHAMMCTLMVNGLLTGSNKFGTIDTLVVDEAHLFASSLYNACSIDVELKNYAALVSKINRESSLMSHKNGPKIKKAAAEMQQHFVALHQECRKWANRAGPKLAPGNIFRPIEELAELEATMAHEVFPRFYDYATELRDHLFSIAERLRISTAEKEPPYMERLEELRELGRDHRLTPQEGAEFAELIAEDKDRKDLEKRKGLLEDKHSHGMEERAAEARVRKLLKRSDKLRKGVAAAMSVFGSEVEAADLDEMGLVPSVNEKGLSLIPTDVSTVSAKQLTSVKKSIFLSATLAYERNFTFIKTQLGVEKVPGMKTTTGIFDSPFNMDLQARLYTPMHITPFPSNATEKVEWYKSIANEITFMLEQFQGDAFILFTSREELERVYEICKYDNFGSNVTLIKQEDNANAAYERFKSTKNSALFGLKTFWEGIDVPGTKLSLVVITKLPFPPQQDPVLAVEVMNAEKRGEMAFFTVNVPKMIFDLRQAAGRLIRTQTDIGVVAVLDTRLWTGKNSDRAYLEQVRMLSAANKPVVAKGYGLTAYKAIGIKKRVDTRAMFLKVVEGINKRNASLRGNEER